MLTQQQIVDKWAQKAGAAANDWKIGIQGVQTSPMQAAVAAQNLMLQKWNEAVTSGRWAARTGAVSLEQWKQQSIAKGGTNYANGIANGKAKMAAAVAYYAPVAQQVKDGVKQFPRDGASGSMQRVAFAMQAFQAAKAARR